MTGDDVRAAKFREKFRGYHPEDVDALLNEIAGDLDAGRAPDTHKIRSAKFRATWRGYNPGDVDRFLEGVRRSANSR